jgi:cytochrome c-type biogenesis protein
METGVILGPAVAFAGGLLSFLSPCVLPLVPSYLGFLTGFTIDEIGGRKRLALIHATLFVVGFSLIFILLGAGATALGTALKVYKIWIMRVGGLLIIAFGLYCLGILRLDFLGRERRLHLEQKPVGFLGSVLVGMAFGAGWSPCIGPILGGILSLAATEADLSRGMWLLVAYSAGLAVPFLVAALAVEKFMGWFQRFRKHLALVQRVSGALLVVVGILILSGQFTRLASWLQGLTPEALRQWL